MEIEGSQNGAGLKFAVVVSRFNDFVTDRLRAGALECLKSAGVPASDVVVIKVPGAFEIPFAAKEAAKTGNFAAIVCLGCLIRGATPHFDYIASACSQGIQQASTATGVPISFGVLTTLTEEQAMARSLPGPENKGRESALAAIEMATLLRQVEQEIAE